MLQVLQEDLMKDLKDFGKIDNKLRQTFANMTGFTRGSKSIKG
jgi:hypothetical protein